MALYIITLAACIVVSFAANINLIDIDSLNIDTDPSLRIIGGIPAAKRVHPYTISLRYKKHHRCAGTIISKSYIVTAAHCVFGEHEHPQKFEVRAGTVKRTEEDASAKHFKVKKIIPHEDYDPMASKNDPMFYDVAILELVVNIVPSSNIGIIDVETEDFGSEGIITLIGWGSNRPKGDVLEDLHESSLKIVLNKSCQDVYGEKRINNRQICTSTEDKKGICYGDSGGPLIRKIANVKSLIGIVSWGTPCARGKPDVFGKVASYVEWFNEHCDNCLEPPGSGSGEAELIMI